MTKEQLTYASGTVELGYDESGRLIRVTGDGCSYSADGSIYRHVWNTNGKVKRKVAKFNQPISLRFSPPVSNMLDFRVSISGLTENKLEQEFSFESINSIIFRYPIRSDLLESMIARIGS